MSTGFIVAGLTNVLGILLFSKGFTNTRLFELYPEVFGVMGCVGVILWGLAYMSVAYVRPRTLSLVFCLEKVVYFGTWLCWLHCRGAILPSLWAEDPLTAFFFTFYGPLDLAFGAFFLKASR